MATGFLMVMVVYMTTGIFLQLSFVRYFWLMLALASAAAYVCSTSEDQQPDSLPAQ